MVGVRQQKVAVQDLEVGMFVSDLDRPWHQTPLPSQGFYIRSQSDVKALVSHCKWVMVDVAEARDSVKAESGNVIGFGSRAGARGKRSEEHTSELQSRENLVCRLLLEKKKKEDIYCIAA